MKQPKSILFFLPIVLICSAIDTFARKKILVDVGHGQKFYSDPADKISTDLVPTDRLTYMTGEIGKNASAGNATVGYIKAPITKKKPLEM